MSKIEILALYPLFGVVGSYIGIFNFEHYGLSRVRTAEFFKGFSALTAAAYRRGYREKIYKYDLFRFYIDHYPAFIAVIRYAIYGNGLAVQ